MKNKTIKKIICIIITVMSLSIIFNCSYAGNTTNETATKEINSTTIMQAGKDWIALGNNESTYNETYFANQFAGIAKILVRVGLVTVMIVTAVMAIKWITATPDKQAKLKQQLIGLVVSIVVIFGAVGIWKVVTSVLSTIENTI